MFNITNIYIIFLIILGINMNMVINWDYNCSFLFQSWNSSSKGGFALGCILTFIFCCLSVGYDNLKKIVLKQTSYKKTFKTISFVIQTLIKFLVMFLMMTMNGFVNLVIILGMSIGYLIFRVNQQIKSKKY